MRLRIAHVLSRTAVEGPGLRAAVWVQGCSIRCVGCFNPHTWSTRGGQDVETSDLAGRLLRDTATEGVTFLGGEPFEQAAAVTDVARRFRAAGRSVMTFTGYLYETLRDAGRPDWQGLLDATDLLVDGPFDRDRADHLRPWVGSVNQRFLHLTDRCRGGVDDVATPTLEVRIRPDGTVFVNGMAEEAALDRLRHGLREN